MSVPAVSSRIRTKTRGATPRRRSPGTGADLTSVLAKKGPAVSVPRGPSHARQVSSDPIGSHQVRDNVPHVFVPECWMSRLRSYGSVVGPVGGAPVGAAESNWGCRKPS